ncbi:MAG: Rab family GTPase [Candidatus Kariarchaeaceae archaeon]
MASKEPEFTFKILLIGDGRVGKTSLVNRFVKNTFTKSYLHTIGMEPSFRNVNIKKKEIALQIFDIAGEKSFSKLREMFYKGAKGGLITFDLTRKNTLNSVESWYKEVQNKAKGGKYILVGNKNDLPNQRQVSTADAKKVVEKLNLLDYIETSALTGDQVADAFAKLATLILDQLK